MPSLPNPVMRIDGQLIDSNVSAPVAALASLAITWGEDSIIDDPRPATLSATLRYRGDVDVLHIGQGTMIEVEQQHERSRTAFSGRVRSMSSHLDGKGRLNLVITATNHLADLENIYIQTDWVADNDPTSTKTMEQRLVEVMAEKGWDVTGYASVPPPLAPAAPTFYNSIKLLTLWKRYLAQHGPQARLWDSSYWTGGALRKRMSMGHMADSAPGDTLTTTAAGTWTLDHATPDTATLREVTIPASNVYRDVEWDSSPESMLTAAKVSFQRTRVEETDEGVTGKVTSLIETNVSRGHDWEDKYGTRTIEIETSAGRVRREDGTLDSAIYRTIGRKWMMFNGSEWRPGALRIRDTTALDPQALSDMVSAETRPRQWITVPGVQVMTPRGALASIRGLATGGTLTWDHDHQRWDISVILTDTQIAGDLDWRFTTLGAHTSAVFSQATAADAGDVQFSAFDTITTLQEHTA